MDKATTDQLCVNAYTFPDERLSDQTFGNGFCGYVIMLQLEKLSAGSEFPSPIQHMDEELRSQLLEYWGQNKFSTITSHKKVKGMLSYLGSDKFNLESCFLENEYWLTDGDVLEAYSKPNARIFASRNSYLDNNKKYDGACMSVKYLQMQCNLKKDRKEYKTITDMLCDVDRNWNIATMKSHFQFLPRETILNKNDIFNALVKKIRLEALTLNYGELKVSSKNIVPRGLPNIDNFCCFNTAINMIIQIVYEAKIEFSIDVADIFSECSFYIVSLHTDAVELITYLLEKEKISKETFQFIQCHDYCDCISSKTNINEKISVEVTVLAISYPSLTHNLSYDASPLLCIDDFGLVGFCIFIANKNKRSKAGMTGEYNIIQRGHYVS